MQQMELMHVSKALADELAAGQSPLRALAMEGGRIAEIFSMGNAGVGGTLAAMAQGISKLAAPLTVAAGAFAVLHEVVGTYIELGELNEKASAAGVSTSLFQAWTRQAQLLRLSAEDAEKAIAHMSDALKGQIDNFSALGLDGKPSIRDRASNLSDVLGREVRSKGLAEGATNIDEMHRAAAQLVQDYLAASNELEAHGRLLDANQARTEAISTATEVWGDAGRKIAEGLRDGVVSIDDLAAKSKETGSIWSDDILDAQRRVSEQIAIANDHLKTATTPALEDVARLSVNAASAWAGMVEDIAKAVNGATEMVGKLRQIAAGTQAMRDGAAVGSLIGKQGGGFGRLIPIGGDSSEGRSLRDLSIGNIPTPPSRPEGLGNAAHAHGGHHGGGAGAGDALTTVRSKIDGEIAEVRRGLSQKEALFEEEAKLKLISKDKKLEMTRAALNEEYAAEMALLQKELALNNQKPQQIQAVNNKIRALEEKHADDLEKVNRQGVERMVQPWHQLIDQISSSFSGSVMGLLEGTKKFSDAVRDMARTVIQHFVQMGVQAVADWAKGIATQVALTISGQQLQTAAVGAGIAERSGLEAGGAAVSLATKATSVIKALAQDAAEVFGGVFAFLAPIMGPAAAAPAGAAAATVAAAKFETGSWYIPHTGLAVLHEGEGVLTAGQNARLHNFMGYIEKGGAGGGNTFHVRPQVNFNVSAADHRDVARWLNGSGRDVMKTIEKQVRLGSHLGLKGLGPA
ncbi:MAG TPA: hypothetical protein VIF34_07385 [Methylocystis sp.]